MKYILSIQTGTSVPHISSEQIKSYEFNLPPLPVQNTIAHILSSLDNKIELNRRMNRTLEQMARALFQSWFVDFDPVRAKMRGEVPEGMDAETAALFPDALEELEGREIPVGWQEAPFDELITIFSGGTPKTSNPEFWNGELPWYSVVDAPNDGDIWVIDTDKKITQAGLSNSPTQVLPTATTIISARGTVGKLALTGRLMAMNQSCYGLYPRDRIGTSHTYFCARNAMQQIKKMTHGAVFDTITRDTFKSIKVIWPGENIISCFEEAVGHSMSQILFNLIESSQLERMRDELLPRLLSGELDVSGWVEETNLACAVSDA